MSGLCEHESLSVEPSAVALRLKPAAAVIAECTDTQFCIQCRLTLPSRSKVGAAFEDKEEARRVRSGKYSLVGLDSFSSPPVSPGPSKPIPKHK